MISNSRYHEVLPEILTCDDIEKASHSMANLNPESVNRWIDEHTELLEYDNQPFKMVIDRTGQETGKVFVQLAEYATGQAVRFIEKSNIARDMACPGAGLVAQPNSILFNGNMNFSYDERSKLYGGNLDPVIGRLATTMASLGNPKDVTIFAPSQGALVGLAYAADEKTGPVSIAIVEAPNIIDRSCIQLAKDFLNSGKDLKDVLSANFIDNDNKAEFAEFIKSGSNIRMLARFAIESFHRDNFAMMGAMRQNNAAKSIDAILRKGGKVVHAWGDQDYISPKEANEEIARQFELSPGYRKVVLKDLGHSATDFYALNGALARLAHNL